MGSNSAKLFFDKTRSLETFFPQKCCQALDTLCYSLSFTKKNRVFCIIDNICDIHCAYIPHRKD